jgi:phosphoribosylaminoimidazolecarboxamide formyltransferase / IMP cyclohydrolase
MSEIKLKTALISVFHKEGLDKIIQTLTDLQVVLYSTGGTFQYIQSLGYEVTSVEELTGFASILDGRVKTLHPKIFGGILARREEGHLAQLEAQEIPEIDLVIVDLYPFEKTVAQNQDEAEIIEKIDIGGISLIRAAAKNFKDVLIIPSQADYPFLLDLLESKKGSSTESDRKKMATRAFQVSAHYDSQIFGYFNQSVGLPHFHESWPLDFTLRYGENPHQEAAYYGQLQDMLQIIQGKELSYNNLVDVDAAIWLMKDIKEFGPSFAILKHTNACGVATRPSLFEAWEAALQGDPVSAFGGVLITNETLDQKTAEAIDQLFYEVLIAPDYTPEAFAVLQKKKNRILVKLRYWPDTKWQFKNLLNGVIVQNRDAKQVTIESLKLATQTISSDESIRDLIYACRITKHLKSNAIALIHHQQLIGMGCGQTSRVDALTQAIAKARQFGFAQSLSLASMASEAFFPFPDCVEIAHEAGIKNIVQPGGSIKDKDSIQRADELGIAMYLTGIRHFKH